MKMVMSAAAIGLLAAYAVPAAAAEDGFVTSDVGLHAGPGNRYPTVTELPEAARVRVYGCLDDWDWCDVSWRGIRGWIFSDYLETYYGQRRVPVYEYRTRLGLPVITFSINTYWDRYYRDRPWFDDRDRWDTDHHDAHFDRDNRNEDQWRRRDENNDALGGKGQEDHDQWKKGGDDNDRQGGDWKKHRDESQGDRDQRDRYGRGDSDNGAMMGGDDFKHRKKGEGDSVQGDRDRFGAQGDDNGAGVNGEKGRMHRQAGERRRPARCGGGAAAGCDESGGPDAGQSAQ